MGLEQNDRVYRFGDENLPLNPVTKKYLKEYYDNFFQRSDFKYYDEDTTRRFLRAILRKGRVTAGGTILDVGCATGFNTEQLRKIGHMTIGVDISRVGVKKGRSKYPLLILVVGDAAAMPFKDSSFNAILVMGCSLTNTRDLNAIQSYLTTLTKYLSDDGVVVVVGASNFSGEVESDNEWIHHRYEEVLRFVDLKVVDADGPYVTNLRLLSRLGNAALNSIFSYAARRFFGKKRWSIIYFIRKKRS